MDLKKDGVVVLPDLFHFSLPTLLDKRIVRGGKFKTKVQVDQKDGVRFLPWVEDCYYPARIQAELITSWPVDETPFGSQLWHRDTEGGPSCIRAMVYLTDVTPEDGPLCYVPGTQRLDLGSNRLTDAEFEKPVPKSEWQTLTGPRGTAILFDIMGFHRGLPNVSGRREALCFTYHAA